MRTAIIWCYGCGRRWRQRSSELWDRLARCPECGSYTDGIEEGAS